MTARHGSTSSAVRLLLRRTPARPPETASQPRCRFKRCPSSPALSKGSPRALQPRTIHASHSKVPSRAVCRYGRMLGARGRCYSLPGEIMTTAPSLDITAEHARLAEATGLAEDDLFEANP